MTQDVDLLQVHLSLVLQSERGELFPEQATNQEKTIKTHSLITIDIRGISSSRVPWALPLENGRGAPPTSYGKSPGDEFVSGGQATAWLW